MSITSSIQMATNAMSTAQLGLQVIGNNIANANTPGYVRENLVLAPAPLERRGDLLFGLGVEPQAVLQNIDRFLEERLRNSSADLAYSQAQEDTYVELEAIIGELSDTDLSTSLTNFFGSVNDILNQPENSSVRYLAIQRGVTLAEDVRRLDDRVNQLRVDTDQQIRLAVTDVNRLLNDIARLNVQIVAAEGADASRSEAVGLRDTRSQAMLELSEIFGVRTEEQDNGAVAVYFDGDYIVFDGAVREVELGVDTQNGFSRSQVRIAETDRVLNPDSGKLGGLVKARDEILGGFLEDLNDYAKAIVFEFNKVHSSGQGLKGYTDITSEFTVDNATLPLDQAGLHYSPTNGTFKVQIHNKQTGLTQTTEVLVPLNGLEDDMTLTGLAEVLNAVDGLSAEVNATRHLEISADSPLVEFSFADDSSGILATLGINTFFTGQSASTMGVHDSIRQDSALFAASRGGIGADTENAVTLAGFLNAELESLNGSTIADDYERMIGETTQAASVARAVADGFRVYQQTIEGQHLAITGVNLDEEVIKMMSYQRMFQASARFVSTISDLLDVLVNI